MEQLIRFLPLALAALQQVPEVRNLVTSLFPGRMPTGQTDPKVVRWVQASLNLFAGENLACDGVYGPATEAAITRAAKRLAIPLQNKI